MLLLLLLLLLSHFSHVQLCDPVDGSPPGSSVQGILQARTLEWVAISFSSAWKWKVKVKLLSRIKLLVTSWTAAYQAPPSMGFSRQEYWSGEGKKKNNPTSQVVLVVKNLPANAEDTRDAGLIPGSGRSPKEGHATHFNILAWETPKTEELDGGCCLWVHRIRHDWAHTNIRK